MVQILYCRLILFKNKVNLHSIELLKTINMKYAVKSILILEDDENNLAVGANIDQVQTCLNDIQTFGWPAEFCALNVFF